MAATTLKIIDIKHSRLELAQDIICAVITGIEGQDLKTLLDLAKERSQAQEILESSLAAEDNPYLGMKRGDLFLRLRVASGHSRKVGDRVELEIQR